MAMESYKRCLIGTRRKKVSMQNLSQPFVKLSTANAELITRFAQSQEMVDLVNTSAQKYLELAQKTFGGAPASEAQADLIRSLTDNYSTFAREHAEILMGMAAQAQTQMTQQAAVASKMLNPTGSR
jgi:CHASE3 domain sensor protein